MKYFKIFSNKILRKLTFYFIIVLITFSTVIGFIFILLFKNYIVDLHKKELSEQAKKIAISAESFSKWQNGKGQGQGKGGFGAYLQSINDFVGDNIWIVDENLNLFMGSEFGMTGHLSFSSDLPKNAEILIEEVFLDKVVFSEDFSGVLSELTLTVGAPIKDSENKIIGVVLIHSPINGINKAVNSGTKMLFISLGIAMVLVFGLSIVLSKNFTDPIISKEAEDALRLENIRRDFVANISHELKTPVTVIRGSLEALIDEIITDPIKVKEYHEQMLKETIFLQRLVGDLLDLSRLQNADFIIEKELISINDVVNDILRSVEAIAKNKNVNIKLYNEDKIKINILGDYGRIRQMILIVLDNSIKFSPENKDVLIHLKNNSLSIKDFGIGINKEELPYIFDRFYRSRSEENKIGTGLGLSIAKQIAERHNIKIDVESELNDGAQFVFNFKNF